jgi:hypothetical protein
MIKSGFKVYNILPLNPIAMVGKFGLSKVFTAIKEGAKNTYLLDAIKDSNNNGDEAEAPTNLLNIVGTFQVISTLALNTLMGTFKPFARFCVEMHVSSPTPTNNQQDELVVNLKESNLELDYLIIPS